MLFKHTCVTVTVPSGAIQPQSSVYSQYPMDDGPLEQCLFSMSHGWWSHAASRAVLTLKVCSIPQREPATEPCSLRAVFTLNVPCSHAALRPVFTLNVPWSHAALKAVIALNVPWNHAALRPVFTLNVSWSHAALRTVFTLNVPCSHAALRAVFTLDVPCSHAALRPVFTLNVPWSLKSSVYSQCLQCTTKSPTTKPWSLNSFPPALVDFTGRANLVAFQKVKPWDWIQWTNLCTVLHTQSPTGWEGRPAR